MKKVIRDGRVAVLYSPGFGAGWSTWAYEKDYVDFMLFDPTLVDMVERGLGSDAIEAYVQSKHSNVYCGGADDLVIKWIPVGTAFRIHEYDGSESVEVREEMDWKIA